ncbi:MAG TPA: hypothetical protein VGF25_21705 [Thermoleophilaceae bacterium]|jgi:hypothetical protein
MPRKVDLEPGTAVLHEGDPERCVVLLPGVRYPTSAPLLWFAREAALARGWSALEAVELVPERADPVAFARNQAELAIGAAMTLETVVIGKSLASFAAGVVAERTLAAIWLTPLLNRREVVHALARNSRPALLIGSPADPSWQRENLPASTQLDVFELEGLDHSLQVEGDPEASLEALRRVTEAVSGFLDRFHPV